MESHFPEAMAADPARFLPVVPRDVHAGDRHVVAAALAVRADVIVTANIRHFPAGSLEELGLAVQTADEFLIHQWWLRPEVVAAEIVAMSAATSKPHLDPDQVVTSVARGVPEFAQLVASSADFAIAKLEAGSGH